MQSRLVLAAVSLFTFVALSGGNAFASQQPPATTSGICGAPGTATGGPSGGCPNGGGGGIR